MSATLTQDILANQSIRQIDIFEFMAFIADAEPGISLTAFADRLWDEVTDNQELELSEDRLKLYTLIIRK
jgi:hypothetical protein